MVFQPHVDADPVLKRDVLVTLSYDDVFVLIEAIKDAPISFRVASKLLDKLDKAVASMGKHHREP